MEKMTAFTDSEYTCLHELDLDGIKERVEKATKWSRVMTTSVGTFGVDKKLEKFMETGSYEDAVFIAHSKSDMSDLIAEVERLREENELFENVVELSEKRRQASEEENARLREALRFYADEANHKNISFAEPYSKVASDYGHHARISNRVIRSWKFK